MTSISTGKKRECIVMSSVTRVRQPFILMFFFLSFLSKPFYAQEPLMAKANKILTISYGVTNFNKIMLTDYVQSHVEGYPGLSYSIKYTNPLALTFDYAVSDYTTLGLGVSYFSFHLKEKRQDFIDTFDLDTKGYRIAIQLRGIRYIVQGPRSVFYMFAGAGIRFRSVSYNTTDQLAIQGAEIHEAAEASDQPYFPLSLEAGMGLKFLVTKRIGISGEFGMMTGIGQFGLFYSLKNKWRRTNDHLGW